MNRLFPIIAALSLLSACGQSDVNLKNASVEDVAKVTKQAKMLNPGEWENQTEVIAVDMPGLSGDEKAAMQAMSQAMIGQKKVSKTCITPAQASQPSTELLAGDASGNCRFDTFSMGDGKMDAIMKCTDPQQRGSMTMKMGGQYGGDSFAMTSQITMADVSGAHGGAGMVIKSKNSGKRIGACPPQAKG